MTTRKILMIASGVFIGQFFPAFLSGLRAQKVLSAKSDSTSVNTSKSEIKIPGSLFNFGIVNNTAAVSTICNTELSCTKAPTISNSLYGKLLGLRVSQSSGEPGSDQAGMNIRGIGTFGYTGIVYYVDGFQVDASYFFNLPQSAIASISVLKDAAALVSFGMQGANGVLWVQTQKGEIGKPKVSLNYEYGIGSPININKPLNSYAYANLYNQAISNDNGGVWSPFYTDTQLQGYQNGTGINVDWYSQALRNSAPYNKANLKFTGGDVHTKYNVLFDYLNQQGLYNVENTASTSNNQFNKYNMAGNLAFNYNIFEAKIDINARLEDRKGPNYGSSFLMSNLATFPNNIYPVYDDSLHQHFSGTSIYPANPVGSLKGLGWTSNETRWLSANFSLKQKLDVITKGLYASEAYSFYSKSVSTYSKTADYARYQNGATTTTNQTTTILASSLGASSQEDWKQTALTLGYDRQFAKNAISAAVNFYTSDLSGDFSNYMNQTYENFNGRFNYTFDNRYVAEIGFSYYGCDAYAPGNKWKLYTAMSGAWIVSNESFLKNNPVISFLKARASYGTTGQYLTGASVYNGGRNIYQQYYGNTTTYYLGNGTPAANYGLTPVYYATIIGPETSLKYNVGLEMTLLKKIDLSIDVFMDKRSGIVTLDNSIPGVLGNNIIYNNIGKMTNKGAEMTVAYSDRIGDFTFKVMGMATYYKNQIDFMAEIPPAFSYSAQTGRATVTPIGLEAIGFYQTTDFETNGSLKSGIAIPQFGKVQPGDLRYKDLNGDGLIDNTDITAIGKPTTPALTYSFGGDIAYKGFDLNVLFQGSGESSFSLLSSNQTIPFVNYATAYSIAETAWAYYPTQGIDTRASAMFPRLTTISNSNNYRASTFWQKNNDFLRLRNVELGYTLPSAIVKAAGISKLRLFVSTTNPVTLSKLLSDYHIDPESVNGYPTIKSTNMGVSVNF
ncbi:MAG: SusC/RagA family TonB-linked outer membrane protein [Paludibacter sp.]